VQPSWSKGGTTRHNFRRGPSNGYFIKVWFQFIEQLVPEKKIFMVEWSLDGPLLKICLVILISNQDGHQAKNRKKGG
jgi:hypothetical protein